MSLSRLALRLAAVEALRPSALLPAPVGTAAAPGGPWPTIAGDAIYDTRGVPLDDLAAEDRQPVVVVYTEEDDGTGGQAAGGPPFKRVIDLVFELSILMLGEDPADPSTIIPGVPASDAELEANLDLLEAQIRAVLFVLPDAAGLWRKLTGRRVTSIRSLPHRSSEESAPIAARTLRLKVTMNDDCIDGAPVTAAAGLAQLPEPLLTVAQGLLATSYGAKIAAALAPKAPQAPVVTPLKTITYGLGVADPSGDTPANDGANVAGQAVNLDTGGS